MKDFYSFFRDKNGFWCGIFFFKEKYVKELIVFVNMLSVGKLIEWFFLIMCVIILISCLVYDEKVFVEWLISNFF